jgi:hypothetical protein
MTPLEQAATVVGAVVALVSLAKAAISITRFFSDLSINLQTLTEAVRMLTQELKNHANEVSALRERVSALESWRRDEREAA